MSDVINSQLKRISMPSVPPPPPEAAAPAPTPVPAQLPVPREIAPPAPVAAPAPTPAPAAPAAPNVTYADPKAMVQVTVDGKRMDVPVGDAIAQYQMREAAQKRLADLNRMQNETAGELALARELRNTALTNPDAVADLLQRKLGVQIRAPAPQDVDDGSDPKIRDLEARLRIAEAKAGKVDHFLAERRTEAELSDLHRELAKYPLYQPGSGEFKNAERVVAATIALSRVNGEEMSQSAVADFISQLHAERAGELTAQTTQERDTRAATAALLATVPVSAGTPGLTDTTPPKVEKESWLRGTGGFRKGMQAVIDRALNP